MRLRIRRASCVATVILTTLLSIAASSAATSIGSLPDPDVIVLFRPHDDHVLCIREETVRGEILRIERGETPRLIVCPAGTLGPWWQAGVPIRLGLMKFADRDAHYPVFAEQAPPLPKLPSIAISATDGFATIQTAPRGSPVVMEATITVMVPDPWGVRLDVYLGVVPPDGEPLSWVRGQFDFPTLTESAVPLPYLKNVPLFSGTFRQMYRAPAGDVQGWHTLYALIVPPGGDPLDPRQWISSSFAPFLVTPSGQ